MFLVGAIALVGMEIYDVWQEQAPELELAQNPASTRKIPEKPREVQTTPAVSTRTIVARNLFDAERGAKAKEVSAAKETPVEPDQSIDGLLLLGTVIAGSERYAIVKVPPDLGSAVRNRRQGRRARPTKAPSDKGDSGVRRVRVGDSLRGYRVQDIEEQKVVLTRGEATAEVPLDYTREIIAPPKEKPKAKTPAKRRARSNRIKRARSQRQR